MKRLSGPGSNPINCSREPMQTEPTVARFGLIRHAETVWNRERRVQGQLDSPLTQHRCGCAYTAGESVCLRPYQLHWLTAAGGQVALVGLNARALD
jgi:D-lyxose ketol-isomerase